MYESLVVQKSKFLFFIYAESKMLFHTSISSRGIFSREKCQWKVTILQFSYHKLTCFFLIRNLKTNRTCSISDQSNRLRRDHLSDPKRCDLVALRFPEPDRSRMEAGQRQARQGQPVQHFAHSKKKPGSS